jgi:UTP:GlnB (protein PII) uridylyltransferase
VGLFGSLARGQALPSSDADLLIVLKTHPLPRWFDRISEYEVVFQGTALPVELFPYTLDEITRLISQPGFLRTAVRELIPLAGDTLAFDHPRSC